MRAAAPSQQVVKPRETPLKHLKLKDFKGHPGLWEIPSQAGHRPNTAKMHIQPKR